MNSGVDQESFLSLSLQDLDFETESQGIQVIKDVAANVYMGMNHQRLSHCCISWSFLTAASDSTSAILETFILAMISFPEIQKKVQEELDTVLRGRLPTHADIKSLPYLSAVIKEVIRYVLDSLLFQLNYWYVAFLAGDRLFHWVSALMFL